MKNERQKLQFKTAYVWQSLYRQKLCTIIGQQMLLCNTGISRIMFHN